MTMYISDDFMKVAEYVKWLQKYLFHCKLINKDTDIAIIKALFVAVFVKVLNPFLDPINSLMSSELM